MLDRIPSGRGNFLSNKGFLIWILCGLLLGGWCIFMMKYCYKWQKEDADNNWENRENPIRDKELGSK
jgi:hypothetical protein